MKNRMGTGPQEYEPVLPQRVEAWLEKKRRQHKKDTEKDVYFIQGVTSKRIKIGVSNDVINRLHKLQTGAPEQLQLLAVIEAGGKALEQDLHTRFGKDRTHGEWFEASPALIAYIKMIKEGK